MADVAAVAAGSLYATAIVLLFAVRSWQHFRTTGTAGSTAFTGETAQPLVVPGRGSSWRLWSECSLQSLFCSVSRLCSG